MRRRPLAPVAGAAVLAVLVLVAGPGRAAADQFVLLDETYVHQLEEHSHHVTVPATDIPSSLTSPVDYREGSVHVRVELTATASDKGIRWLVCFLQPGAYACALQQPMDGPGVYDWDQTIAQHFESGPYDHGAPPTGLSLIIRDAAGVKVDPGEPYDGAPDLGLYYPLSARVTVTMVSNGATYEPPVETPDAGPVAPDAGPVTPSTPDAGEGGGGGAAQGGSGGCAAGGRGGGGGLGDLAAGIGLAALVARRRPRRHPRPAA